MIRQPSGGSHPHPGFEQGGPLDVGAPSASLAGLADAVTRGGRLAGLDDDELIGVLRAWWRLEAWCSAGTLAAVAELARRRPAERTPAARPGEFPAQVSEFVSDQVAAALTLSSGTASTYVDLSLDLAIRLPATFRALHEGVIDRFKARVIAEATRVLTDDRAREVEAQILPAAGQQTTGRLRAALNRAVIEVDPAAATRRREEAQKDPRVRRWQEDAGTAALGGFGLPPAEVLEADQRITDRALALRDAGLTGSLEELRARAYLDTLLGQDSAPATVTIPSPENGSPPEGGPAPEGGGSPPDTTPPSGTGSHAHANPAPPRPGPARPPRLASRLNVTVTLTTLLGLGREPGSVAGFGPIDPELARDLATLAANHPASRYCITVTDDDGQPLGHGCARGQPPSPDPGQPPPARRRPITVTISPLARDTCDHRHQEPGYQPSRRLQHLVGARTTTCCAPGCGRPAAQCDLDHTIPYDQGGRTCECDLAPLCRHHHRCKQSHGWRLEQSAPGVMAWTTPAGRRFTTQPDGQSLASRIPAAAHTPPGARSPAGPPRSSSTG